MKATIHPAVFLAGALLICGVWLWLRPALPLPLVELPSAPGGREPPYRQHTVIALDAATLERYVGTYEVSSSLTVEMTLEDGRLFAEPTGYRRLELLPYSRAEFFVKDAGIEVTFEMDEDGRVEGLVARTPNGTLRADRVR